MDESGVGFTGSTDADLIGLLLSRSEGESGGLEVLDLAGDENKLEGNVGEMLTRETLLLCKNWQSLP